MVASPAFGGSMRASVCNVQETLESAVVVEKRPSFSMLGWALNEQDNVADYIAKAEAFLSSLTDNFELILIDDGSADQTRAIVIEHQATRPWLRLITNERNRGAGYNAKLAISLATKEYLFWQTVDWSYDISML